MSCYGTLRRVLSRSSTLVVVASSTKRVSLRRLQFDFILHACLTVYTYIQSRFYRSPEVILGMNYHMAIDIWSLGCILAELYTGFPIFPGENEQEQLSCIMEVLGVPDKDFVNKSSRKRIFFGESASFMINQSSTDIRGRRQPRRTSTGCKLKRSKAATWDKIACASPPMQRRGFRRFHL
jgi:serine/threonine protein kinase